MRERPYDVLVIGGGHAGIEAAWAAARLGARTALVTHSRQAIGRLSCNPAIGGIGKGQIVREIDALGGLMGLVSDATCIQFRMLNRRKGPALWAPRAQADSHAYPAEAQRRLSQLDGLEIVEAGVDALLAAPRGGPRRAVEGVVLADGRRVRARSVVIASGTFLGGLMHCGEERTAGGRIGEAAAARLSDSLRELGLTLGRLKTGTCPRVSPDSADYALMEQQPGDEHPAPFSFLTERIGQPQVCCWVTYTNPQVHEIIRQNLGRAPLYSGQIESTGPRYCPSIETKVVRFPEKDRHQIFVEPEGRSSDRLYLNGVSTSLPKDVQLAFVRAIRGLEKARIVQWGYAVEYDFVPPEQIEPTLMTKRIVGLFLAGQINGTSGYEEAAGQGIVAGINAARHAAGREGIVLGRDESYIGVMIDDLCTRGLVEPYRMFSSRAEHRLHLRYDNADLRLTPLGRELGLVDGVRWRRFDQTRARLDVLMSLLATLRLDGRPLIDLLRRPDEDGRRFILAYPQLAEFEADATLWGRALVQAKYAAYIERQRESIERFRALEHEPVPGEIDYAAIPHLRHEARERLTAVRPRSLGQASRISGVQPTDIATLAVYLSARARTAERRESVHDAAG